MMYTPNRSCPSTDRYAGTVASAMTVDTSVPAIRMPVLRRIPASCPAVIADTPPSGTRRPSTFNSNRRRTKIDLNCLPAPRSKCLDTHAVAGGHCLQTHFRRVRLEWHQEGHELQRPMSLHIDRDEPAGSSRLESFRPPSNRGLCLAAPCADAYRITGDTHNDSGPI